MYYAYAYKNKKAEINGLCVVCGEICLNLKKLYEYFQKVIDKMAQKGVLFCYDENGQICRNVDSFAAAQAEIDNTFRRIEKELAQFSYWDVLPPEDLSIPLTSQISFSFEEDNNEKITEGVLHYHNVVVTLKNTAPSSFAQTVARLNVEKSQLQSQLTASMRQVDSLSKQKKQYKYVVILTILVLASSVALILFYRADVNKSNYVKHLEGYITELNDTISQKDEKIESLNKRVDKLNDKIENITQYVFSTGASLRTNDSADNGWILWIYAKRKVQILSFWVKGSSSSNGEVKVGLYDTDDSLVATSSFSVSSSEFKKISLPSDWIVSRGYYYIRIIEANDLSLQYHSSNNQEYSQFSGGALAVTGCSSYSSRSDSDSRNSHSYYQYFYHIQYRILAE